MRILHIITVGAFLSACQAKSGERAGETGVCPAEVASVSVPGDANGDGAANVADVVILLRYAAEGGAAPACDAAVDLLPDGRVQLDDAFSLLTAIGEDYFYLGDVDVGACGSAEPLEPPADCADLQVRLQVPASAEVGTFSAQVTIASADLAVEGWSLPITAAGSCQIAAATTDGTRAAPVYADPPGLRSLGYDATFASGDSATSLVVLGFMQTTALPRGGTPQPVLSLDVEATGCGTCTLVLGEPAVSLDAEIPAIIAAQGASWPVPRQEAHITICP